MVHKCAICQRPVKEILICNDCKKTYSEDIESNADWIAEAIDNEIHRQNIEWEEERHHQDMTSDDISELEKNDAYHDDYGDEGVFADDDNDMENDFLPPNKSYADTFVN